MLNAFSTKTLVFQISQTELTSIILIFSSIIALALSVGLFIALIYLLRRQVFQQRTESRSAETIASKIVEDKVSEISENYSKLSQEIGKLKEEISKLSHEYSTIVTRLNNIETRVTVLERRTKREDKLKSLLYPRPIEEKVSIKDLQSLSDLKLYVPQIKFAALITSQGYIVESYGQGSEIPSKLLEIAKLSEKFTNSRNVSITRGNNRIEVFYIGDMEDLSIYGIIEVEKRVDGQMIQSLKESLIRYFNKKFKEVK